jgi:hypothetical protein
VTEGQKWAPELGPPAGDQYKWGVNGETGELTIWEVSGPGDGFPSHETYLATAWGRRPRYDGADIFGAVAVEEARVGIRVYRSGDGPGGTDEVPEPLLAWARETFPGREIG